MGSQDAVDVSVVVAVYKCAPCLRPLHQRLRASLSSLTDRFEMVFVEDAGADGSWEVLTELARADPAVRATSASTPPSRRDWPRAGGASRS